MFVPDFMATCPVVVNKVTDRHWYNLIHGAYVAKSS